jgi:type IV pilus assembly protein PilW
MGLYLNGVQQREYQNASNLLQENERYLREILTRGVHQAGFENWQEGGVLRSRQSTTQIDPQRAVTDLVAFNNAGLDTEPPWGVFDGSSSMALQAQNNAKNRYLNNDVLMLRFQGMNDLKGAADGSLINCVGLAEAATPSATAWRYRPWVAFGVVAGTGTGGEPELTCRYLHPGSGDTAENSQAQSAANWVARPLARGVEVFQLMLAVASGSDKTPLQWLTPYQVAQQGLWPALLAVRFGMVLRSPNRVFSAGLVGAGSNEAKTVGLLTPLGAAYTREESEDPGVRFTPPDDGRLRRMLVFTVALRNPLTPEPG